MLWCVRVSCEAMVGLVKSASHGLSFSVSHSFAAMKLETAESLDLLHFSYERGLQHGVSLVQKYDGGSSLPLFFWCWLYASALLAAVAFLYGRGMIFHWAEQPNVQGGMERAPVAAPAAAPVAPVAAPVAVPAVPGAGIACP